MKPSTFVIAAGLILSGTPALRAAVEFSWAHVGNAGNAADTTTYGSVNYDYWISTTEVTLGQYTEFLNAVAKTDTYFLYDIDMEVKADIAGIKREGSAGNYVYSVIGSANRPVTYVTWFDAARFINWLHNGQGSGNTEDGVYDLSLGTSVVPTRKAGALYSLPSENEWYKAAYYDPTKDGVGGYWLYPTQSDTLGGAKMGVADSANYSVSSGVNGKTENELPTRLSDVGAYGSNSASYYGTFDQGGNAAEWTETPYDASKQVWRGGHYSSIASGLRSNTRGNGSPLTPNATTGFRVVTAIPEPSSILFVVLGGGALLARWARRSSR